MKRRECDLRVSWSIASSINVLLIFFPVPVSNFAGQLFSADDGNVPHVTAGGLFPKRGGVQVSKVVAPQAARSGLLPQRLGCQVNEHRAAQAAGHGLLPKSTGIQVTDSHVAYAAECGTYPKEIGVQAASKFSPISRTNITRS